MVGDEWLNLAAKKKHEGIYEEALICYKSAEKSLIDKSGLYKSFGKLYYILGRKEDSVKSYVSSIKESGYPIVKLINDGGGLNILNHLGHAIVDEEDTEMALYYRQRIDPYYAAANHHKFNFTDEELNEYENKCIITAYNLLLSLSKK